MTAGHLLALRAQPPEVDAELAQTIARTVYGLTGRAVALAGERDRNFRLDTAEGPSFVIKFIDQEADEAIVAGQSAALAHLAEHAPLLSLPRIIPTLAGGDLGLVQMRGGQSSACRVRLVSYLRGSPIQDRERPVSNDLLRSSGEEIARLDRALCGFFHPALGQPIAWDIRRAAALLSALPQVRSPELRRLVEAALDPLEPLLGQLQGLRSQAIHGDCHGGNLLANDAGTACVGIIDLGDMIHAPLALEVAVTMAELLADGVATLDGLSPVLAGYTAVQPLEQPDIAVLYDSIAARIAIGVLIASWRGLAEGSFEGIAAAALDGLASRGKDRLRRQWLEAAGVATREAHFVPPGTLLRRRHAALGANAELSYERPLHLVRGEGVWVYTADGERLLDVYNNVPHVGHSHPTVVGAIAGQAKRIASNTRYLDERIIEYSERLTATLPPALDTCVFVNSGSEANDIAWQIAKAHTGGNGALVMANAYHGVTEAITALSPAISATAAPHIEQLPAPAAAAIARISHANDGSAHDGGIGIALERLAARGFTPAALLIDSALTSTGIYDPSSSWIAPIAAAAKRAGALIIADEVQLGLGRSGSDFWGFSRRGFHPDIVTLGKPVGNGYPLGVVITRRPILEKFHRDTGFFSTFGGNPVAAAAGLAVLEVLERENLVDNARTSGDYFLGRLRELAEVNESIREVRGCGLMIGVEVADRTLTHRIVNGLRDRGVLAGSEGPRGNVLKLRPPMPFRPEHVDIVLEALTGVLSAVRP